MEKRKREVLLNFQFSSVPVIRISQLYMECGTHLDSCPLSWRQPLIVCYFASIRSFSLFRIKVEFRFQHQSFPKNIHLQTDFRSPHLYLLHYHSQKTNFQHLLSFSLNLIRSVLLTQMEFLLKVCPLLLCCLAWSSLFPAYVF